MPPQKLYCWKQISSLFFLILDQWTILGLRWTVLFPFVDSWSTCCRMWTMMSSPCRPRFSGRRFSGIPSWAHQRTLDWTSGRFCFCCGNYIAFWRNACNVRIQLYVHLKKQTTQIYQTTSTIYFPKFFKSVMEVYSYLREQSCLFELDHVLQTWHWVDLIQNQAEEDGVERSFLSRSARLVFPTRRHTTVLLSAR